MSEFKSCTTCHRETNNQEFTCPVKGDYQPLGTGPWMPRCAQVWKHLQSGQYASSLDQRMFLTHNAEDIMKRNAQDAYMRLRCAPCYDKQGWDQGTMLAETDKQECNARTCTFRVSDPYGLGRGRKYWDQDQEAQAKAAFIAAKEKENEYFKSVSECCGTVTDDMAYYPIHGGAKQDYARYAVPSGGAMLSNNRLKTA